MEINFASAKTQDTRLVGMKQNTGVVDDVNIIARLKGWGDEGSAEVEILVDEAPFHLGERYHVEVRSRMSVKFDVLRSKGLRVGGLVLLRKAIQESSEVLSCKSAEAITQRETDGYTVIHHRAAVCILPPPPGVLQTVNECLIALGAGQVKVKFINDALIALRPSIEDACQLGKAGIILTGEDASGEITEVMIGGKKQQTADELINEFTDRCPRSAMQDQLKSKKTWKMVAFVRVGIDVERASKISAQRMNFEYLGTGTEFNWSKANVVLREAGGVWSVCETTPPRDSGPDVVGILLDKL